MRRTIGLSSGMVLLVWAVGCVVPYEDTLEQEAVRKPTQQAAVQGLVWMFPGVVGQPWELGPAYRGLRDGGVEREYRVFQWDTAWLDFPEHLADYVRNVFQAAEVASQIAAYKAQYPDRPVILVGHSAGGFMAVKVAELLPADVRLQRVVIAQPSISPTYDLTAALRHIDGQLVSLYCPSDWFLSGVFSEFAGTMDRQYEATAGKDGFDEEAAVPDAALRTKLVQVPWSPLWRAYGHEGDHMSILEYAWNRYIVAPFVLGAGETGDGPTESGAVTGA